MPAATAEYGSTWDEPDRADGVGRAVLLVVGVQDEQHLEGLDQPLVGLELLLAHLEQHREEVRGVAEVVVGVDVRLALRVPERPGAERRHLGDQPDDLHLPVVGVGDVARLGVERRQRADRGQQHAHRVGVVAEALHEALDVLVHERVERDLVHPRVVLLGLVGSSPWTQQVGHLEVRRLLGQLLDRVAAVLQDALVAVDEGDGAAAGRGVRRSRGRRPPGPGRPSAVLILPRSAARMVPSVIGTSYSWPVRLSRTVRVSVAGAECWSSGRARGQSARLSGVGRAVAVGLVPGTSLRISPTVCPVPAPARRNRLGFDPCQRAGNLDGRCRSGVQRLAPVSVGVARTPGARAARQTTDPNEKATTVRTYSPKPG